MVDVPSINRRRLPPPARPNAGRAQTFLGVESDSVGQRYSQLCSSCRAAPVLWNGPPTEYRMIRFTRSFGCFSLAVLSLSGCTTGTVFDTYPQAAAVLGFNKPDRAASGSIPTAVAAHDADRDSATWARGQQ